MSIPIHDFDAARRDRRRSGRIQCTLTKCQFGEVKDMSRDGCRVISRKPLELPEGKTVNLQFVVQGAKLVAPARLVACRERPDGKFDMGFQFMGMSEQDKRDLMMFARSAVDCADYKLRKAG